MKQNNNHVLFTTLPFGIFLVQSINMIRLALSRLVSLACSLSLWASASFS